MTVFASDIHASFDALERLLEAGEPAVILGDLANLTDYRTGEGALAEVLGLDFALAAGRARADSDYERMSNLWSSHVGDNVEKVRSDIGKAIVRQYKRATEVLAKGTGWVIHGNVDHPGELRKALPASFTYAHEIGRAHV